MDKHAHGRVVSRVVVQDPGAWKDCHGATLQRRLKGAPVSVMPAPRQGAVRGVRDAGTLAMHFGTNGSLQDVPRDAEEPASTGLLFEFTDGNRLAYLNPAALVMCA